MTTATLTRAATRTEGSYGFRSVARMEWLKLRSVRSTGWILLVFAAGMIGLAILLMAHQHWATMSPANRASFDPTNNSFAGLAIGQLALGVLGALVITTEFSSGMIRATLAAVPRRPLLLAAKAAVLGAVALAAGEILAFSAFAIGEVVLRSPAPHATLGQPGVLRAVLMAGAYPALIALIGLGLGAIIRHTAGAICAVVGILFVLPLILLPLGYLDPELRRPVHAHADRGELADRGQADVARPLTWRGVRHAVPLRRSRPGRRRLGAGPPRRLTRTIRLMEEEIRRVAGIIVRAPLTRRTLHELLYCGFGGLAGVAGFCLTVVLLTSGFTVSASIIGTVIGLLLITVALRVSRRLGSLHRRLLKRFLGHQVEAPLRFQPGSGLLGRLDRRLRDRAAWRGVWYSLIKLPVAAVQLYSVVLTVFGLVDLSYPVDWLLFHNTRRVRGCLG